MTFNSITFFVFLFIVYGLYRVLPHRGQNFLLLVASYVFYGWWDYRFLYLLTISTALDFYCGLLIHNGTMTRREQWSTYAWVAFSSVGFVLIQWRNIVIDTAAFAVRVRGPIFWDEGYYVLLGSIILVLAATIAYPKLISLAEDTRRRIVLGISVVGNLSILGFFKYFNFFVDSLQAALAGLNLNPADLRLEIVLPVGISFYTFQTMSYTIDIYRRKLVPTSRLSDFALYVTFFPQLVAGPIERAVNLLPQILHKRTVTWQQTVNGIHLILYGLFKKVVIADGVARVANEVFANSAQATWIEVIAGAAAFAIQIYGDFSGYSDIAIGTANLFGVDLMRNFHFPYFSVNAKEFWSRWHISLSTWLRDYLYIPLGGNRYGTRKTYRNLMLTMLLGGLWHGAAWNFVLWGFYQGALLCIHRMKESLWPARRPPAGRFARLPGIAAFFAITCYGWILFRAHSWEQIRDMTFTLFRDFGNLTMTITMPTPSALAGLPIFFLMELVGYHYDGKRLDEILPVPVWSAAYAAMIVTLIMGAGYEPSQFIYFVF